MEAMANVPDNGHIIVRIFLIMIEKNDFFGSRANKNDWKLINLNVT